MSFYKRTVFDFNEKYIDNKLIFDNFTKTLDTRYNKYLCFGYKFIKDN